MGRFELDIIRPLSPGLRGSLHDVDNFPVLDRVTLLAFANRPSAGQPTRDAYTAYWDNLTVRAVPEPAQLGLLGSLLMLINGSFMIRFLPVRAWVVERIRWPRLLLLGLVGWPFGGESLAAESLVFDPSRSAINFAVHPATGEIYATERDRIGVYDAGGKFLRSFGELAAPTAAPRPIRVNEQGQAMVVYRGIQLFDSTGSLQAQLPSSFAAWALGPDGRMFVAKSAVGSNLDHQIDVYSPHGVLQESFPLPAVSTPRRGLSMDIGPDGLLYVLSDRVGDAGSRFRGIEVLNATGDPQRNFSLGPLLPTTPSLTPFDGGLRIARNGNVLVGSGPRDIDVYDSQGNRLSPITGGLFPTTDFDVTPSGGIALREFANGSRIRTFSDEESARLSPQRPMLHFVDGPFGWATDPNGTNVISDKLNLVGIGADNRQSETSAGVFQVPGEAGVTQSVTVTWHPIMTGMDGFGIFDPTAITADPTLDPRGYAEQALRQGQILFRQSDLLLGELRQTPITKDVQLTGGSMVAFFFTGVSVANYEEFLANPVETRRPLLSVSEVNLGGFDQLVAFAANGRTLIGFEDLARGNRQISSDNNFSDEMFSFNVQLIPVPEPDGAAIARMAAAASMVVVGRRGRKQFDCHE